MSAAGVIAAHRQVGATKFSHRNGSSYVEWPKCGCGERMHPQEHARHVAEKLAEAGFIAAAAGVGHQPAEEGVAVSPTQKEPE